MAVVTDNDKKNTVSLLQQYSATILDTMNKVLLLRQEALDKTYQPGGADAITDAFLNTNGTPPPFPQLQASDLTAALSTLATLDTTLAASSRAGYKALERMRP